MKINGVTALLLLCVLFAPVSRAEWNIQTIDSVGNTGYYPSLALGTDGHPRISYIDVINQKLKYAAWDGGSWVIQVIDSTSSVMFCTAIILDLNESPNLSYRDFTNQDLKYAQWTGAQWDIKTVDSFGNVGNLNALAIDTSGYPHISHVDLGNYYLKYAKWNGNTWAVEAIDTTSKVEDITSIKLDKNDNPHISYFDNAGGFLKYISWTGSSWQSQVVDSGGVGSYFSLVLDSSDNPHISYKDNTLNDLKYAHWTGTQWSTQTIDSIGDVGEDTSLAIDNKGYPCISYSDFTNNALKYAQWTGTNWSIQVLDTGTQSKTYSSLALDTNGHPAIAYWGGDSDLKFAKWELYPVIYPSGSSVLISGAVKISAPAGAVQSATAIRISSVPSSALPAGMSNPKLRGTLVAAEIAFTSGSGSLLKPITIAISYTPNDILGFEEDRLGLFYWDAPSRDWILIPGSVVDANGKTVSASVNHLSLFRIMEYTGLAMTLENLSNYPNPFRHGSTTRIRYSLARPADVRIRIYDLLGGLVFERDVPAGTAGLSVSGPNELTWDGKNSAGKNVAVGAYICLVECDGTKRTTKIGVK